MRMLATAFDPVEVGRRFKADKVIYLELLEMRMRRPEAPTLLQGRISASVAVFWGEGGAFCAGPPWHRHPRRRS